LKWIYVDLCFMKLFWRSLRKKFFFQFLQKKQLTAKSARHLLFLPEREFRPHTHIYKKYRRNRSNFFFFCCLFCTEATIKKQKHQFLYVFWIEKLFCHSSMKFFTSFHSFAYKIEVDCLHRLGEIFILCVPDRIIQPRRCVSSFIHGGRKVLQFLSFLQHRTQIAIRIVLLGLFLGSRCGYESILSWKWGYVIKIWLRNSLKWFFFYWEFLCSILATFLCKNLQEKLKKFYKFIEKYFLRWRKKFKFKKTVKI